MKANEIFDNLGEWPRYFLFCIWIIDIVMIFTVYHLETCLRKKVANYIKDRHQQEDYVNSGASGFTCEQAS
ncbi:hypothetical protein R3I94_005423 [Phoxinus phoxinus]